MFPAMKVCQQSFRASVVRVTLNPPAVRSHSPPRMVKVHGISSLSRRFALGWQNDCSTMAACFHCAWCSGGNLDSGNYVLFDRKKLQANRREDAGLRGLGGPE